jgi:hypothetical protein
MALVPDRQDAADHRAGVLQYPLEVQPVDPANPFDQVHVQVNPIVVAASDVEVGKRIAFGQLQGEEGIGGHGVCIVAKDADAKKAHRRGPFLQAT